MLINNLKKLVSFQTTPDNMEEISRFMKWIKSELPKGLYIREFNQKTHPILYISTRKTISPKILLATHIDIVSGPKALFRGKIQGDKFFGRGVFDMKFAIASYLALINEQKEKLKNLDVGILITSDEEIGGMNGTRKMLENGLSAEICFLPDGGNNFSVERTAKGFFAYEIECEGLSAHGSRTWEGVNAIERLMEILKFLKNNPIFPSEPCGDKEHLHNTLNIGIISGGKAVNQIPDSASCVVDIRYINKKEKIEQLMESLSKKYHWVKITKIREGALFSIDIQNQYLRKFCQIVEEDFHTKTSFVISHGSSDARFFASKKIPVILTRPKGGGPHSDKEWVSIKSLKIFHQALTKFVLKCAISR